LLSGILRSWLSGFWVNIRASLSCFALFWQRVVLMIGTHFTRKGRSLKTELMGGKTRPMIWLKERE
jgi:hypothetical protein